MTLRLVIVVVVLHIYPFTGQRQTLTLERSGHFSLHWLLRGWKNPHSAPAYRSFQCSCGFLRILVHWICCLFKAIIVKRLVQGRSNVTRVRVEARSCDQGRRKNDAFSPLPIRPRCRILLVDIDTTTLRLGIVCFKIRSWGSKTAHCILSTIMRPWWFVFFILSLNFSEELFSFSWFPNQTSICGPIVGSLGVSSRPILLKESDSATDTYHFFK